MCMCTARNEQIWILIKEKASQSILQPNCSWIKCNSILVLEKAVQRLLEVPMPRQFLSHISYKDEEATQRYCLPLSKLITAVSFGAFGGTPLILYQPGV